MDLREGYQEEIHKHLFHIFNVKIIMQFDNF